MKQILLVNLILFLLLGTGSSLYGQDSNVKNDNKRIFFEFAAELFGWIEKQVMKVEIGQKSALAFQEITTDDLLDLERILNIANYDKKGGIWINSNHHLLHKHAILPNKVYRFIKNNLILKSPVSFRDEEGRNLARNIIYKLLGALTTGDVVYKKPLPEIIDNFSMREWEPINYFINELKTALTLDDHLADKLGRILLPFFENYYDYFDYVGKIRILRYICEDYPIIREIVDRAKSNTKVKVLRETLAVRIFLASGSTIIKFLQQLQEHANKNSSISKLLVKLDDGRPVPGPTVIKKFRDFYSVMKSNIIHNPKVDIPQAEGSNITSLDIKDPLGVASIAQTMKFNYFGQKYALKMVKPDTYDTFLREKELIKKMFKANAHSSSFHKGLRQLIDNMIQGIEKEMDLQNELENIRLGLKHYNDESISLESIGSPPFFNKSDFTKNRVYRDVGKNFLVMDFAAGKPLAKILREQRKDALTWTYNKMVALYVKYHIEGIDPSLANHFYHGDTHRGNIFINYNGNDNKNNKLILIDFGNSGPMPSEFSKALLELYIQSKDTMNNSSDKQEKAIDRLGLHLKDFVLSTGEIAASNEIYLTEKFFNVCFNTKSNLNSKSEAVNQIVEKIKSGAFTIEEEGFANALISNCLTGSSHPILNTLSDKRLTLSEKLDELFTEFLKNGITFPTDIIFFNKSKGLLEGILSIMEDMLYEKNPSMEFYDIDEVFSDMIFLMKKRSEEKNTKPLMVREIIDVE